MSTPCIRPDARAFLDNLAANPRPPMNDATIGMMRQLPKEMVESMILEIDLPVGELGEMRDLVMPGPAGDIELRLFDPRTERGPGPVVVFYHGGGFVAGSIGTHTPLCAEISRQLDLPVVSVEYRLAPENKWPAATDDAEAATRWIAENGAAFGREFTHLITCGDSAGGTLTLVTTLALRNEPAALPLLMQIPIYPVSDRSKKYPSGIDFADGYGLDSAGMDYYDAAYGSDKQHWKASPLLTDLAGLPPTLLVTAALDPLRDEGRAFAAKAIEAGVQVTYREFAGTVHGFCTFRKALPSAVRDFATVMDLARAMMAEALAG